MGNNELEARGVKVSEVFHCGAGPDSRRSGPDPERRSYQSFAEFNDPDTRHRSKSRARYGR
jgi:hypothetical protein